MSPNKNLLIAVSGGRSSAMMARHIQTNEKYAGYNKLFVFCNTGQEKPQTIQFLKDMVEQWQLPLVMIEGVYSKEEGVGVKHKIVDFDTLDMNSTPLKGAIMQMNKNKWTGVFNQAVPYCSEYTKVRPSHSFAKEIFGTTKYHKAIGYRKEDMPKRISWAEIKEESIRFFPLLTDFNMVVGLRELDEYFNTQPFKLQISSKLDNCEICHKAGRKNIIERIRYGVRNETLNFYRDMQAEYGNMFLRGNESIDELVESAAKPEQQTTLFDKEDGCVCTF